MLPFCRTASPHCSPQPACASTPLRGIEQPTRQGYTYKISICDDLPNASVPVGCKNYDTHASVRAPALAPVANIPRGETDRTLAALSAPWLPRQVVRYNASDETDCIEVGSLAKCEVKVHGLNKTSECGLAAKKSAHGPHRGSGSSYLMEFWSRNLRAVSHSLWFAYNHQ